MTVVLRPLVPADLDRIDVLEVELFGVGAWSRGMYEEELRAQGRWYVAAVDGEGILIGYAGVALGEDAEVMTIGVSRARQRQGVGARLLGAVLDAAREARARRVFLEVRADDDGARRFYARAGFRSIGLRRGYYQPENADAVVMVLELARIGPVGAEAVGGDADGAAERQVRDR